MDSLLLFIFYLLLTFILTLLCYKFFGKYGLIIWICTAIIMCNIQTIKISEFLGMSVSLGNILYCSIFLSTSILTYKYGTQWATKATNVSFIVMIVFCVLMYLFVLFTPSPIDTSQSALETIFSFVPRVTLASFIAYYIGQTCNIHIFEFLNKKFNKVWINNGISISIGQTIDSIIFTLISFVGVLTTGEIVEIIVTMIIIKLLITVCNTPFMYITNKIKKVREL